MDPIITFMEQLFQAFWEEYWALENLLTELRPASTEINADLAWPRRCFDLGIEITLDDVVHRRIESHVPRVQRIACQARKLPERMARQQAKEHWRSCVRCGDWTPKTKWDRLCPRYSPYPITRFRVEMADVGIVLPGGSRSCSSPIPSS